MENYMTHYKNVNGLCPYCQAANNFSILHERRPMQKIHKCNICNKFCVFNERNGARYPLENPLDQNSMPKT